jgi:hypothetical protein
LINRMSAVGRRRRAIDRKLRGLEVRPEIEAATVLELDHVEELDPPTRRRARLPSDDHHQLSSVIQNRIRENNRRYLDGLITLASAAEQAPDAVQRPLAEGQVPARPGLDVESRLESQTESQTAVSGSEKCWKSLSFGMGVSIPPLGTISFRT